MIEKFMERTLQLAQKGIGKTSPNPIVGAVIVKNGRVVGEGYHRKAGFPHAEIKALQKAGKFSKGASLFVNLEPCCHTGKTSPCTDKIIKSGIKTVYVGMRDPNPMVSGKGIRILREHGIEVVLGVLRKPCQQINEIFIKYIQTRLPFVILKSAVSLDGKIATRSGDSKWITGVEARREVHRIRNFVDAILVGAGTVKNDNPRLTTRLKNKKCKNPTRIIFDNEHQVSLSARVFQDGFNDEIIYVSSREPSFSRARKLEKMNIKLWVIPGKNGVLSLVRFIRKLGRHGITSLLIEGGGEVNASFLKSKTVDKVIFFISPFLIGGAGAPSAVGGMGIPKLKDACRLQRLKVTSIGNDLMVEGYYS